MFFHILEVVCREYFKEFSGVGNDIKGAPITFWIRVIKLGEVRWRKRDTKGGLFGQQEQIIVCMYVCLGRPAQVILLPTLCGGIKNKVVSTLVGCALISSTLHDHV